MTRNKKTVPAPWGELHPDLLRHIYTKLYDPADFIRFRAVCKGWCVGTPLSELPPQFPLLLEREPDPEFSPEFKLYSLPTGRTYKLQLPEAQNKMFFGQSQGHLVTFGNGQDGQDTSPALLNPFTRAELPLPFGNHNYFSPIYIGTTDPTQNTGSVVIYARCPEKGHCLGLWNQEENDWVLREIDPGSSRVWHKERLFIFDKRRTWAIDLTTGRTLLSTRLPDHVGDFYCLVEASGALLGIVQHHICSNHHVPLENCWFEVYRLEEEENPPHWNKLSDIGDLMIFLNSNNGFVYLLTVPMESGGTVSTLQNGMERMIITVGL